MPNKYAKKKVWNIPKQKYKLSNWSEYSDALRRRGEIDVWLSEDAISQWSEQDRVYVDTGTPQRFSDFSIITCHEIQQVYRLPLRQSECFITSLFRVMNIPIVCPDFSCLSKRLGKLNMGHYNH